MTYICLGRKVSKVEKFRILQTCHSYNESAIVVSFQFLVLVDSRTLVVLVYWYIKIYQLNYLDNKDLSFRTFRKIGYIIAIYSITVCWFCSMIEEAKYTQNILFTEQK